jgi:3-oxoadipate enol-lactonase
MEIESPLHIEHAGAHLFAVTLGSGPDVVLLHPTPVHHVFWHPVAEQLTDRYRLTLVDLRGHGESSLGLANVPDQAGTALTMDMLADDIHAIVQALGIQRAAFIGCSIGSYTLYEYWRRFPQEMAALVLTCGKPQPDTEANREKRTASMQAAQQPGGLAKFLDQTADTLVGPTARRLHPQIHAAARAMMDTFSLEAMLAVQHGLMQRPDSVPTLKTIHVPVCVIAGGEDQGSTPAEMHVIAEQAPHAEFHVLEDAGHYAPLEQPAKIAAWIGDFLNREYDPQHSARAARKAN